MTTSDKMARAIQKIIVIIILLFLAIISLTIQASPVASSPWWLITAQAEILGAVYIAITLINLLA